MENEKLVYYVYEKLHKTEFVISNKEDLIQEGFIGLIKAEQTYNSDRRIKYSTYATICIKNAMLMYLRNNRKHENNISTDSNLADEDDSCLMDTLEDKRNEISDDKLMIDNLLNSPNLNDKEKEILNKLFMGYKKKELKLEYNINQRYFTRLFKKAKVIINDFTN